MLFRRDIFKRKITFLNGESIEGKCIAVIHRTNDNDDKLIVVPEEKIHE